ncbi:MAG: Gfo/Idh/MocA family oxidoreductase [Elusimicrobiota bacterium]|nr:Gfo/Idh/MocA family oxidoreductase [Elusimicrobiota bacterium]
MRKPPIRTALIVGCGSIARRHAANLKRLGVKRVLVCDLDAERAEHMRRESGCVIVASVAAGLDSRPGAALICTPPSAHAEAALAAIARGVPCFVEKPAAHTALDAERIRRAAAKRRVPVMIGYQLRFHPAIAWIRRGLDQRRWGPIQYLRAQVGQYLPDWRPWQDYRKSYTARRSLGGGILLDASHEIDLALHLAGPAKSVYCAADRLSALDVDVEDTAEMTLRFRGGAMGSVHLDMIRRAYDRSCQLLCRDGVVEWSYQDGLVREYRARSKKWTEHAFTKDPNAMYLAEMKAFLALARGAGAADAAGPEEGAAALRIVEAAKRSAAAGRNLPVR